MTTFDAFAFGILRRTLRELEAAAEEDDEEPGEFIAAAAEQRGEWLEQRQPAEFC